MKCKCTASVFACASNGQYHLFRSFCATNEEMLQYKQVPFYKCCLAFHGFMEEEQHRMETIAASNGFNLEQNHVKFLV
jgi:hypothetical protein